MAAIPEPRPGLLFRYGYLWLDERKSGRIESSKDRPSCIVARVADADVSLRTVDGKVEEGDVIIFPITTKPPQSGTHGVELTPEDKRRCGLDPESRSWVIVSEFNADVWPNADMSIIPGRDRFDYGMASPGLLRRIGQGFAQARLATPGRRDQTLVKMEYTAEHKRPLMALVTDLKEFAPVHGALSGIGSVEIVIQREFSFVPGEANTKDGRRIEIEIRGATAWEMAEDRRKPIEARLRETVETIAREADLHIAWCRPIDIEWVMASLNVRDRLSRDWHRRRIDDEAFHAALDRLEELHDRVWNRFEEWRPLMSELDATLEEARRHPTPQTELSPLPKGAVAVGEVVTVLRRILSGSALPQLVSPKSGWKHLFHSIGEFTVEGWTIRAFKRSEGVKYIDKVTAPDGRAGDYNLFASREGGPIDLLEDDEQDRLDAIMEGLPQVEESDAGVEAASDCRAS